MKFVNRVFGRACLAFLVPTCITCAAEIELLPDDVVRIRVDDGSKRIDVHVSSNLVNWVQFTSVVPTAGEIKLVDRHYGHPARFFRLTPIVAPPALDGKAFTIGNAQIQITNGMYFSSLDGNGAAAGWREQNTWTIEFGPYGDAGLINSLQLQFATATNGFYALKMFGQPVVTGSMHEIPFRWPPDGSPAPATISDITFRAERSGLSHNATYTVDLNGGASGTFVANLSTGEIAGSGTFIYTPSAMSARLILSYSGDFTGDIDDVTLQFKQNPAAGAFTGIQRIAGTTYTFTGRFTYE